MVKLELNIKINLIYKKNILAESIAQSGKLGVTLFVLSRQHRGQVRHRGGPGSGWHYQGLAGGKPQTSSGHRKGRLS
jgi:hypothetical protein